MSDRDRYARSFGSVADLYEASRPLYADGAIEWVAARLPLRDVLDLGAGTGKLTRQLVARGANVVAVEPDPDMRATFARVLPNVEVLDGRAEAIPLADSAVDTVAVGQAFHWFDVDEAMAELRRVTRPGGGLAALWNRWRPDDPVLGPIDELLNPHRPPLPEPPEVLASGEYRQFEQHLRMTVDQLVGWAASTSGFVNATRADQQRIEREIRAIVGGDDAVVTIDTDVVVAEIG